MRLAIRIGTGLVALGLAGTVSACSSSSTPSGTISSASGAVSSAVSSASSAVSSAASSVSSAVSAPSSGTSSGANGTASVSITNITGGSTTITFDQNYLSALNTLKLNPTAVAPATLSGGTAMLPVTGGSLTLSDGKASGMIKHSGGIQLTAGPAKIDLTNFVIDPAANAIYADISVAGQTLASHVDFFNTDASSAQTQASSGSATISGVKLTLSNDAATALNKAASTQAIQGNFPVGTATIKVQGS